MLFGELDPDTTFCIGVSSSFRIVLKEMLKRNPTTKQTIPGTKNAARQLHNPVNVPATRGAKKTNTAKQSIKSQSSSGFGCSGNQPGRAYRIIDLCKYSDSGQSQGKHQRCLGKSG